MAAFNWEDEYSTVALTAKPRSRWRDFWADRLFAFDARGSASTTRGPPDALLLHRTDERA
jgi:hypothetical protein